MSDHPDARLQRLLGGDHLGPLRKRLRHRFERAPAEDVALIRVGDLSPDEHSALASLIGRAQRLSRSLQIDVRSLDAALQRSGVATSLRDALEKLDGPIVHRATERQRLEGLWSDVVGSCGRADVIGLLRTPAGLGLLKRLARGNPAAAAQIRCRAETVLERLPANGITRSQLAADTLGDAHALDEGKAAATLVLAVRRQSAAPVRGLEEPEATGAHGNPDQADAAERSRDVWASAGVLVNELARPALFLNLPSIDAERRGQRGEPAYVSLRSLLRSRARWDVAGRTVHVCENPNLVAIAADRWGRDCAPVVCTDGMPAAAQRCLLTQLAQAGARLLYHGDFDWPGLRIGNLVMREHGARPWRFSARDYLAAAAAAPGTGHHLRGKPVEACWDEELSTVMQQRRISVDEEALADSLLQDLHE